MSTQPGVPGSFLSLLKTILVKVNKWRKEPKYEMSWLMDVYLWSNPVEEGQNDNCHLRFRAKLQDGKNDFRKLSASLLFKRRYW